MAILLILLGRTVVVLGELVAASHEIHVLTRGRDSPLGLLLEDVEHVDRPGKIHGVDSAICAAVVILDELQHARTAEPLSGFAVRGIPPSCTLRSAVPKAFCSGTGIAFKSFKLEAIQYSGLSGTVGTGDDSRSAISRQAPAGMVNLCFDPAPEPALHGGTGTVIQRRGDLRRKIVLA
jgi:hypothetical protein